MKPILPTREGSIVYDYDLSSERIIDARNNKITFSVIKAPSPRNRKVILESLRVQRGSTILKQWPIMNRAVLLKFMKKETSFWGEKTVEIILSARSEGCLYYHTLYYFGSFEEYYKHRPQ